MTSLDPINTIGSNYRSHYQTPRKTAKEAKEMALTIWRKLEFQMLNVVLMSIHSNIQVGCVNGSLLPSFFGLPSRYFNLWRTNNSPWRNHSSANHWFVEIPSKEYQFTVIFITHDLGVVQVLLDKVAVMYAGEIVEFGKVEEIFYDPKHPYTWSLLSSLPQLSTSDGDLYSIPGLRHHCMLQSKEMPSLFVQTMQCRLILKKRHLLSKWPILTGLRHGCSIQMHQQFINQK